MNVEQLMIQTGNCATFFYQNREQEAYELLGKLLPNINQLLQNMMQTSTEYESLILTILKQFLEAYQQKDGLALADILQYEISMLIAYKKELEG